MPGETLFITISSIFNVLSGSGDNPFSGDKLPVGNRVLIALSKTSSTSSSSPALSYPGVIIPLIR